jgi:hypothetical protein
MIRLEVSKSNLGEAIDVVGRHTGNTHKGEKKKEENEKTYL